MPSENAIERGKVRKPAENKGYGMNKGVIQYGIQQPGADFDRRPEVGSTVTYVGPSKVEGRSSNIKSGNTQKKKHPSTGKGQ